MKTYVVFVAGERISVKADSANTERPNDGTVPALCFTAKGGLEAQFSWASISGWMEVSCEPDYQELLKRYIKHVSSMEGIDYIERECAFTPAEQDELLRLALEIGAILPTDPRLHT